MIEIGAVTREGLDLAGDAILTRQDEASHRGVQLREGHGLGLAIVRAIADAHGAFITARARPTGGLDIKVTFPRHPPPSGSRDR